MFQVKRYTGSLVSQTKQVSIDEIADLTKAFLQQTSTSEVISYAKITTPINVEVSNSSGGSTYDFEVVEFL